MASSRNYVKERENLNDGITVYMLGLQWVVGNVVLSVWPGGGDALTRGLNEVRRKINGGALRNTIQYNTYNSEVVKLNSERKQCTDLFLPY